MVRAALEHAFLGREQQFPVTLEELGCLEIPPWLFSGAACQCLKTAWSWTRTEGPPPLPTPSLPL